MEKDVNLTPSRIDQLETGLIATASDHAAFQAEVVGATGAELSLDEVTKQGCCKSAASCENVGKGGSS